MTPTPISSARVKRCAIADCTADPVFRANTRPAWCATHLEDQFTAGGLRTVDDTPGNYTAWRLTECLACGTRAHYKLEYVLDQTRTGTATCRACYWRAWAGATSRAITAASPDDPAVRAARDHADANGYDYLGALTSPSYRDDPHHVRCRSCARLSAQRLGDISFGCPCVRNSRSAAPARAKKILLVDTDSPALAWWDHDTNEASVLATVTPKARREVGWRCPVCDHRFTEQVLAMTGYPSCPECSAVRRAERTARDEQWKRTPVASIPELASAWADDADPTTVMVAGDWRLYRFRCPAGHHPRITPRSFLLSGCPSCRGNATRARPDKPTLVDELPEVAEQWHPTRNGTLTARDVGVGSKRTAWWLDPVCGHEWESVIGTRDKYQRWRCPECRTILDSLAYQFPLLAAEWSPTNPVTAWQVRPRATTAFVPAWVCATDSTHQWQAPLASRGTGAGCPECKVAGKSAVELEHHAAAVAVFGSAKSGAVIRHDSFRQRPAWSVDILATAPTGSPFVGVAIEYDGAYWHAGKSDVDAAKSRDLLSAGYLVVRLREDPLPPLDLADDRYLEVVVYSTAPRPDAVMAAVADWVNGAGSDSA